jgi:uncharacterized protein (DUF305 family)
MQTSYTRFAAMIITSTIVMFVLMYLNTYQVDHVWFSQTRMWMALYMGAAMADTVGDEAWMKAMIPHHSIAILTSSRANISDPRVRKLADGIIEAQRREIAEMEALIADLDGGPAATPEIDGK